MNPVIQKMIQNNKMLQKQRRYYERTKYRSPQINKQKIYYASICPEQKKMPQYILPHILMQSKPQINKNNKRKQEGFLQKYRKQQITKQNLILLDKIQNIFKRSLSKSNKKISKPTQSTYNNQKRMLYQSKFKKNSMNRLKYNQEQKKKSFSQNKEKYKIQKQNKASLLIQNFSQNKQSLKKQTYLKDLIRKKRRCQTQQINYLPKFEQKRKKSLNVKIYQNDKETSKQRVYNYKQQQCNQRQGYENIINQKKFYNYFKSKGLEQKLLFEPYCLDRNHYQTSFQLQKQSQIQQNKIILASKIHQLQGINFKIDFIRGYQYYQICAIPQQKYENHQKSIKQKLFQVKQIQEQAIKSNYVHYKMFSPHQKKISKLQQQNAKETLQTQQLKSKLVQKDLKINFSERQGKQFFQRFDYDYEQILSKLCLTKSGKLIFIFQNQQKHKNHKKSLSFSFNQKTQAKNKKQKACSLSFRYNSQQDY